MKIANSFPLCVLFSPQQSIYLFLKVITCFSPAKNKLMKNVSRRLFSENSNTAVN